MNFISAQLGPLLNNIAGPSGLISRSISARVPLWAASRCHFALIRQSSHILDAVEIPAAYIDGNPIDRNGASGEYFMHIVAIIAQLLFSVACCKSPDQGGVQNLKSE